MNELDIVLFKKSKIIEIGSVEKNIWLFKVGDFSGNPKILALPRVSRESLLPVLRKCPPPKSKNPLFCQAECSDHLETLAIDRTDE